MADDVAVLDAAAAPASDIPVTSEPVSSDSDASITPVATETPALDPNDPFAALQTAMDGVLPKDEPAADGTVTDSASNGEIPEQFAQALTISQFVTSPEGVQQAVRAADEVWKVATGEIPARQMLEGFRNTNPAQFQAIVADLKDYLGVQSAQTSPLDAFKQSNPAEFKQIADFYQQVTGKALDGTVDPNQARLDAIEQRFRAEEESRQVAVHNQQVEGARKAATDFVANAVKGSFADGMAERYVAPGTGLLWQKAMAMNIAPEKLTGELLQGKTDTLNKILKAVQKDEVAVLKQYNANLIKAHRTLANGVPATKGGPVKASQSGASPRKEGESDVAYATRLWNEGKN